MTLNSYETVIAGLTAAGVIFTLALLAFLPYLASQGRSSTDDPGR